MLYDKIDLDSTSSSSQEEDDASANEACEDIQMEDINNELAMVE